MTLKRSILLDDWRRKCGTMCFAGLPAGADPYAAASAAAGAAAMNAANAATQNTQANMQVPLNRP